MISIGSTKLCFGLCILSGLIFLQSCASEYTVTKLNGSPDQLLYFDNGKVLYGINPEKDQIEWQISFNSFIAYAGTYSNRVMIVQNDQTFGKANSRMLLMDRSGKIKKQIPVLPNAAHFWTFGNKMFLNNEMFDKNGNSSIEVIDMNHLEKIGANIPIRNIIWLQKEIITNDHYIYFNVPAKQRDDDRNYLLQIDPDNLDMKEIMGFHKNHLQDYNQILLIGNTLWVFNNFINEISIYDARTRQLLKYINIDDFITLFRNISSLNECYIFNPMVNGDKVTIFIRNKNIEEGNIFRIVEINKDSYLIENVTDLDGKIAGVPSRTYYANNKIYINNGPLIYIYDMKRKELIKTLTIQ